MPMGELSDLIDLYAASEGNAEVREKSDGDYFPDLR